MIQSANNNAAVISAKEQYFDFAELAELAEQAPSYSRLGNSYICLKIKRPSNPNKVLLSPMRMDCMTIILCRRGSLLAEVNLKPYKVRQNSLLVVMPNDLLRMPDTDLSRIDAYIMMISRAFLVDINIDLNALNIRSLIEKRSPMINLSDVEAQKLGQVFDLLDLTALDADQTVFSRNVARSLCASVFYQLLQFNFRRISQASDDVSQSNRRSMYVHDFMRLVHLNYMRHRTVSYYAGKLFISPKYLTQLVKEATGRTATEWINEFVIIEAKNLLRYSGKNVQQVAYALNFNNQSLFGKYFKHLTGMSPTEYQKS